MLPIPRNVFTINDYTDNRNSVRSIAPLKKGNSGYYLYPKINNVYNANNNNVNNGEYNINEFNNDNKAYYNQLRNNSNNNINNNNNENVNKGRKVRFTNTVKVKPYTLMNNYKNYIAQRYEKEPDNPILLNIINRMKNTKSRYIKGTKKPSGTRKRSGENKYARTIRRGKYTKNTKLPQTVLNRSEKDSISAHEYAKIMNRLNLNNEDKLHDINRILKEINNSQYPSNIDLGLKSYIYSKYRKGLTPYERDIYKKYYRNEMEKLSRYNE